MLALSQAEYDAETTGGRAPEPSAARDGLWVVPQPMPGEHSPLYTLTYLLRDDRGGLHLIDPGFGSDANHERFVAFLAGLGASPADISSITVTHLHHDHLGAAERLRRDSGAPVAVHRIEQAALVAVAEETRARSATRPERLDAWGVPAERRAELEAVSERAAQREPSAPFEADRLLETGDLLDIPGRDIRVLHTPGHTPGHISVVDADSRVLFTGDHLLPTVFPGLGLGGPAADPVGDYLRSLDAIDAFGDHEVFPGHGYRFTGLTERVEVTRQHHLTRSAEIAEIVRLDPHAPIWRIAERVHWSAGWHNLRGFYLQSALAQTEMHVNHLRAQGLAAS
ncbi:MBL fold metallo-hydrolase [Herbiconiux daphne]|uniref:MBL fold metallo-hydrolase n=1 Tax=Herbiconiux daphne TaxID=2970914 RepID=A0ABT2H660_9MICO|nr:MBL fold metallo-hydrolase [Herbiconiux daphne]MCS5735427.1 MBL fold metallo-hydrolase [Herbiconiux daphne]